MLSRAHRSLLLAFSRFPRGVRRRMVRFIAPSFTVGATCLIERPDGAILLVKQVYRHGWGVPGGLLKRREEPVDAVCREVMEEVGLAVELLGEPVVVVDPMPQRVDVVFRGRPMRHADLEHVRPRSPEIEEVRWFAPDALPELQFETANALVALARSSRSPQAAPLAQPDWTTDGPMGT